MQQEKYGLVYIWFDRKHKRFYIGSHWGTEDDGYICSSRWMRKSYRRRPQDFKRRIISRIYTNRLDLLEEEYKFLSKISDDQLGKKYYNLTKHLNGHWSSNENSRLSISEKLKIANNKQEAKEKIAKGARDTWKIEEIRQKRIDNRLRTIQNDPTYKERQSQAIKNSITDEDRKRTSEVSKRNWANSEYKELKTQEITERWANSEMRSLMTENMKKAWDDPEIREKRCKAISEGSKGKKLSLESIIKRTETRRKNGWNKRNIT